MWDRHSISGGQTQDLSSKCQEQRKAAALPGTPTHPHHRSSQCLEQHKAAIPRAAQGGRPILPAQEQRQAHRYRFLSAPLPFSLSACVYVLLVVGVLSGGRQTGEGTDWRGEKEAVARRRQTGAAGKRWQGSGVGLSGEEGTDWSGREAVATRRGGPGRDAGTHTLPSHWLSAATEPPPPYTEGRDDQCGWPSCSCNNPPAAALASTLNSTYNMCVCVCACVCLSP